MLIMVFIRYIKIEKLIKVDYIIWINFGVDSSLAQNKDIHDGVDVSQHYQLKRKMRGKGRIRFNFSKMIREFS